MSDDIYDGDDDDIYFPWHKFQLWLRSGFFAGFLLNKIMIASWPEDEKPFPPQSHPEEIELLKKALEWAQDTNKGEYVEVLNPLTTIEPPGKYPKLANNEARTLWLALSEYGTATESYQGLQNDLRKYLGQFVANPDKAIKNGMDALWRSIGPALDPERSNIEEAEQKKGY